MSAATSQPLVGHNKSAAPFGAVALIAGVLAFGAIGIALVQGSKATAVAGAVPADVQAALIAQRMGEKMLVPARDPRFVQHQGELADSLGAYAASDPRLVQHLGELADRTAAAYAASDPRLVQHLGELADRTSAAAVGTIVTSDGLIFGRPPVAYGTIVTSDGRIFGRPRAIPDKPDVRVLPNGRIIARHPSMTAGPRTAAQKGLVAAGTVSPLAGKIADDAVITVNPLAGKIADDAVVTATRYSGKTRDALSGSVAANRWTILANNPYAQGLLSRTVSAPATYATGGLRFNHR